MAHVYYNEIDPNAAEWLRQLIKEGAIAPGDVDERSIVDVPPVELESYDQCHFFAGIGTWSYALRQAGWPDERPVWTGSPPCQPFSSAGKRKGADDERDLWWAMFWLIQQCHPPVIIGEQVASTDGLNWWDIVQSDLEGEDYAAVAFDLCAAGIGAPHVRQRLFWVANTNGPGWAWTRSPQPEERLSNTVVAGASEINALADSQSPEREWFRTLSQREQDRPANSSPAFRMDDSTSQGLPNRVQSRQHTIAAKDDAGVESQSQRPGATSGYWSNAIWLPCTDGKWRAAQPGTFPLVNGVAADLVQGGNPGVQTEATAEARAMRIKGYGNAIVAPLAIEFIQAFMEVCDFEPWRSHDS